MFNRADKRKKKMGLLGMAHLMFLDGHVQKKNVQRADYYLIYFKRGSGYLFRESKVVIGSCTGG